MDVEIHKCLFMPGNGSQVRSWEILSQRFKTFFHFIRDRLLLGEMKGLGLIIKKAHRLSGSVGHQHTIKENVSCAITLTGSFVGLVS